ncbi:MAG TPA: hypothetical protein CFH84_03425 [Sulfurimonas sp. UBA12504]|nr:MAG TPA: hypothetical protein CFH84_03425 [Sulfurimonas sp. UBA12504]
MPQDVLDELYNAIDLLNKLLETPKFKSYVAVSEQTKEDALSKATKHLFLHNDTFGIEAKSTDVYKLLSWYGYFLNKRADDTNAVVYLATISILNKKILKSESCGFMIDKHTITEMYKMLTKDGNHDHLAIGKNGLYIAFKTAQSICIQQQSA